MEELRLKNYSLFLDSIPQNWQNLSGLAYTPYRFFDLAGIQMQNFLSSLEEEFKEFGKENRKDYTQQCYSSSYGFYVLIRTCIEVSGKFNKAFQEKNFSQELESYRELMKDEIQKIINIANDYVKHPVENQGKFTWYEPGGLDYSGEVSLYEWSTQNKEHFVILTVNPKEDFIKVYSYLEKLAEIYIKNLPK